MKELKNLIFTKTRVGYYGHYYLIVPDHAAGMRNRFTVYRIPASPSRRIKVVGRELTLGHAKRVVEQLTQKGTRK